jgi:hypothetical protein
MRLTDDIIRRQKRPTRGQLLLWDDLVSGFGVRLTPTKTAFVVQWRDPQGRKPRESLRPRFPQLSTTAARELARKRLGEVLANTEEATAQELRVAMRAWFERKSEVGAWRPKYRSKVDALIRHFIEGEDGSRSRPTTTTQKAIEDLGRKPVGSVSRSDVMRVADGIKRGVGRAVPRRTQLVLQRSARSRCRVFESRAQSSTRHRRPAHPLARARRR